MCKWIHLQISAIEIQPRVDQIFTELKVKLINLLITYSGNSEIFSK